MSKSRIADKPTVIPQNVQVLQEDNLVKVKGKKWWIIIISTQRTWDNNQRQWIDGWR